MLIETPPARDHKPAAAASPAATAALITAAAMTILDVSKVGVALPVIQESFGAGATGEVALQLMMIGYTVAYAVFLLPSGRLGDIVSRKAIFLVGIAAFTLASLACALAPTPAWLVAGRVLQGAGAGILMPQVVGLIQRMFAPADRGRPLAALAVTTAITSALGPVLAGIVMELVPTADSWRWLFWINVVVGLAVIPLAWASVVDIRGERRPGYDYVGALLLAAGLALFVIPLGTVSEATGLSWASVASVASGAFVLVGFVLYERRRIRIAREPLLDLGLFRRPGFGSGLGIAAFMHATGTSSSLILTLYLQQAAGLSPLQTALAMILSAATLSVSSTMTGRLRVERAWSFIWVGASVSIVAIGGVAMTAGLAPSGVAIPLIVGLWALNGVGTGMISAPNQSRTLSRVPEYRASVAGSSIQLVQRVGSAIGMGAAMVVYFSLGNGTGSTGSPGAWAAFGMCTAFLLCTLVIAIVEQRRYPAQVAAGDPIPH